MNCPHCNNVTLVPNERQGVEIDYCPQCRGVWLDRGELDKIVERANAYYGRGRDDDDDDGDRRRYPQQAPPPPPQPGYAQPQPYPPQQYQQPYPYHKRKKSFWEELFD